MNHKKRFGLWTILAIVCVLSVIMLVVLLLTISGSGSPSETVKATIGNANQGRYSSATNGLSRQLRFLMNQGMEKLLWDGVTRNGRVSTVEILKEEVRGEGATVRFKIHYKNGGPVTLERHLLKEDGDWKLLTLPMVGPSDPDLPMKSELQKN